MENLEASTIIIGDVTDPDVDVDCSEKDVNGAENEKVDVFKDEVNKAYDDELLVKLVKESRSLWDTSFKGYRDKDTRKEAWIDISGILNRDVDLVKRRWKNLRDGMVRCLKKLDHSLQPGSGYLKTPMCRMFNQLLFLKETISCNTPSANLSDSEEVATTPVSTTHQDVYNSASRKRTRSSDEHQSYSILNRRVDQQEKIDVANTLPVSNGYNFEKTDKESSDWLFCKSLVEILEKMPPKQNRMARVEIQQVLLKYEFAED